MRENILNLGYRTDFFFNEFDGTIENRGEYIVVKTKSNPHFFWGNLLLYKNAPTKDDFPKWKSDFRKEFSSNTTFHMTFAWDTIKGEEGQSKDFVEQGFSLEQAIVLSTEKVQRPIKYNESVHVKTINQNSDFDKCIDIQISSADSSLSKESWSDFYSKSMRQYQKMIHANKGKWFAATLNGEIVGSLGIFTDGNVGRFQIVSTDPMFQRKGICSTLVYESAKYAYEKLGVDKLVMVADENYHAAKIYESVGFNPTQKQTGLCWWDKEKFK